MRTILPQDATLNVLAAEAAREFAIRPPAHVVRADVSQAEPGIRRDVAERRLIDLERFDLEPGTYDVVLFVNVLEHVRDPLRSFPIVRRGLKESGLFVLVLPNVTSVKSLVTRLVPPRLRRIIYTRVLNAPSPDVRVRNVHSMSLRPSSLLSAARNGGWNVEYFRLYEGPVQRSLRERAGIVGRRWSILTAATRLLTLGLLSADETGIIAVLSKNGIPGAASSAPRT